MACIVRTKLICPQIIWASTTEDYSCEQQETSSHEIYISGDNTHHFLLPEDRKEKKSSIHIMISQDVAQTLNNGFNINANCQFVIVP